MASNPKKPRIFNVKKEKKLQDKKRKLEAFLNLVRKDEETPIPKKKKPSKSFAESYAALKDELKKYRTKDAIEPTFSVTDHGQNSLVKFSLIDKPNSCTSPLFVEDIYHLLLKSLLGNLTPFPLRWAKLERPQRIAKNVVIEIDGLSKQDILEMNSELYVKRNMYQHVFEMLSSIIPFATELTTLHMATGYYNKANENYSSLFPMNKGVENKMNKDVGSKIANTSKGGTVSKLHLLLSPIQLIMERCPLPQSVFHLSDSKGYVFSKESYAPVTDNSPMFALDCEMCKTTSGKNELTRVAIVDENLDTVYHTLVKPRAKITDYLTKYSGITARMLQNVTTTLEDVQDEIRKILPKDAIMCGQSLTSDLHALHMMHPYIIDTSIIFNQHGVRGRKTSLKNLTKIHLNEVIQNSSSGHHPVEDSIATMKLVQLKLKNNLHYGDAVLSQETGETVDASGDKNISNNSQQETSKFSDFVQLNTGPEHYGFFDRIAKFSHKKVCLIGNEDALSNYRLGTPNDKITQVTKSSNKKIIKATVGNLEGSDLIISHLALNAESGSLIDIINGLKQIYDAFPNRTLFLLLVGRNMPDEDNNFKHSYCITGLKTVKSDEPS